MSITATFVRSAAGVMDLPRDGLVEIAVVGRSNVGKSSLINALVRRRVARTSSAPGKTRLANIYKVARGTGQPFYLVDLPGYGYARGGSAGFAQLAHEYFRPARGRAGQAARPGADGGDMVGGTVNGGPEIAALLLVDARHPGLAADVQAWRWLGTVAARQAVLATKIDKLTRAERQRAISINEAAFEHPVLAISAATGEGLDELWRLIDRLNNDAPRHLNTKARPRRRLQHPHRTEALDQRQRHPRS